MPMRNNPVKRSTVVTYATVKYGEEELSVVRVIRVAVSE